MSKEERIEAFDAVDKARSFEEEQAAISRAALIDMWPSPRPGFAGLYPMWGTRDIETTRDYLAVCLSVGVSFDDETGTYIIPDEKIEEVYNALQKEAFVVSLRPSLIKKAWPT